MAENLSSSKSLSLPPCVFSCRIVVIDYYLASPLRNLDVCFSDFRSSPVEKVPIIRIFGATPAGQKSCMHVHGAFPYLLVPCLVLEPTDSYLQQLARSIDHALQVSLGASSRTANHVFKIVVVKGIPFYGYHETEELFLRIYLVNPGLIKRLAELLLVGAVMNQVLQPHESHIPFPLQFMIDYNLFGMNHIHLSAVKFRVAGDIEGSCSEVKVSPCQSRRRRSLTSPLLSPLSSSCSPSLLFHPSQNVWDTNTLPSDMILCEPRRSVTELEVDVLAADILNRHELSLVSDGYPGLAAIWEEERQRRTALNIDDPLSPPPSPDRGSQPYHLEEMRLKEVFERVLEERLGTSADSANFEEEEVSQSTPSDDIIFSQSCDLDLHQPIESEGDADSEPVANSDQEVLVDEEAIKQSMELSQRLSKAAIEKSTDAEMLELMTELCQTPLHMVALSQSHSQIQYQSLSHTHSQFPSSSQSVGEQLTNKMKRSHSILSARSLFSSDSEDGGTEDSEDDLDTSSQLVADREEDVEPEGAQSDKQIQMESGDDLFIAMETDIDNRKFSSPVVKISSEDHQQEGTPQGVASKKVAVATPTSSKSKKSSFRSSKRSLRYVTAGDTDEESEVELPITTPLASPIPPSPKSKEQQCDIFKELDSFGSDEVGRELDEMGITGSQFDVSFGQIQTPSTQCSTYSKSHPELDKVWNSSTSDTQSPLRLVTEEAGSTGKFSRESVQLEYEMPEITVSQLETSSDPLFNPLEAESPQTPLSKGQQSTHVSMTSSLCKAKRKLISKPMAGTREGGGTIGTRARKSGLSRLTKTKVKNIPQLDGINDKQSSPGNKSSRKRKRTLGLQRTRKRRKKNDIIPQEKAPEKVTSSENTEEDAPTDDTESALEKERKEAVLGREERVGESPDNLAVPSEMMMSCQSLEDEVASLGAEVQVIACEGETDAEPRSEEGQGGREDAGSKKRGSSSDDSQQSRGKGRRRLSLKKPANRTHRTRESILTNRKIVPTPRRWRSAKHLQAKALRSGFVLKVDKLPKRRLGGSVCPLEAAKQQSHKAMEQTETSARRRRRNTTSVSSLRSESDDNLSNKTVREREERRLRRSLRHTTSDQSLSPVLGRLSFEQQLKKAIDMSKESYHAESAESTLREEEDEVRKELSEGSEQTGSPLMFSPPASDDLNRTVVEESPLLDDFRGTSHNEDEASAAGEGGGWNLDMSISSISESPPYTSSPQEGEGDLVHESDLKLQLETSLTELDSPPQSSSPLDHKSPSLVSDEEFPVVLLANEDRKGFAETKRSIDVHRKPAITAEAAALSSHSDSQDQKWTESHDQLPLLLLPRSPETIFSLSEVEQLLSSLGVVAGDKADEGFHLAYSSSSEEEMVVVEGKESPGCLDFSTEKTSLAVRFAPCVSPNESQGESSPEHEKREAAAVEVGVVNAETSERGWVCPALDPPTLKELTESVSTYNLRSMHHQKPFYSCPTDVQRPLMIGGRSLRVPSKMPYDLKEYHVAYSREGESENAQFSSMGLHHMRTVLSMVSMETQPPLPPVCHPQTTRTNRTNPYTFDDYKRDMELRASFFKPDKVVITPALPPPHPGKLGALLIKTKTAGESEDTENEGGEKERAEKREEEEEEEKEECEHGDGDVAEMPETRSGSLPLSSPSSLTAAPLRERTAEEEHVEAKGRTRKSPSLCRSEASFDESVQDTSLTSYQVPRYHGHSTPMVVGVARESSTSGGVEPMEGGEEQREEVKMVSLTPVRKKNSDTSKLRPLLPFTPIPTHPRRDHSQLEGPTPNNPFGFKVSQSALPGSCDVHDVQFLTCMSVELHARTRGVLRPDPDFDPILAIFYYIHNDWPPSFSSLSSCRSDGGRGGAAGQEEDNVQLGIIAIDVDSCGMGHQSPTKVKGEKDERSPSKSSTQAVKKDLSPSPTKCLSLSSTDESSPPRVRRYLDGCGLARGIEVEYVSSEVELIEKLVELVKQVDPDFLLGYEITMASWGYLIDRAAKLNINLTNQISRMPNANQSDRGNHGDNGGWKTMLNIIGRIMFGVWRLLKHEIALNVYSFENVVYHILHQRVPNYSFKTLTSWYDHPTSLYRHRVVEHYLIRCQGNHQLLESFNLIGRTSEFSRLYGIEFESVVNRGSQYRVESMMLRLAKPANFIAVSPSVQQRARMAAPECIPLVLEPESKFYADPVLLLDFQSLYPSMVIAYNYCFSTCLGRVHNLAAHGNFQFGASSLNVPNSALKKLKDKVHISPNGVVYVKHHIRKGILTRMLEEILGTRIMVKASMKKHKQNKGLERMLNARQLGLKLIANTTYGYTGASFSGRMPCIEVADSIVRKGRETLERAIHLVNSSPEWRARVVYGDTDSLFVLLKGVSKDEAFRIGKEMCDRITADNPKPVKLKFEKVYLPCILQTKKRYVGFMYESLEQKEAEFDAKGIETVRRDGCPAVAKVLEKSLRLLYSSKDVSQVKSYVQRQFKKVLEGRVDLKDYTFAKEYRGRQYYRPGASVPALELTKHSLLTDRRSEPRMGERVPYVIVYGTPGQPVIQLVKRPEDLLDNPGLRLNGVYYITKQLVPALDRCFSLLGVDVRQWYSELPQVRRAPAQVVEGGRKPRGTIGQYFATMHCPVCEQLTVEGVCSQCRRDPAKVATTLTVRMRDAERACCDIENVCRSCIGSHDPSFVSACVSLDCPVNYRRYKATQENASLQSLRKLLADSVPASNHVIQSESPLS